VGPVIWVSGPDIDIELRGSDASLPPVAATGIIDTGASAICMDHRIPKQLGLTSVDRKPMQMADGTSTDAVGYMVRLRIEGLGVDEWIKAFGIKMTYPSTRVLLGRSFLQRYHLTYLGPEQLFHYYHAGAPVVYEEHDE
jgi:predicted aspartyl protease